MTNSQKSTSAVEELGTAISHSAGMHEQFVALSDVWDVWDWAGWGGWCWAGCWDYLLFCFLAKHRAGTTHSACPCSGTSGRSGRRQVPGCPLGLSPSAIPLALSSQDCPSGAIQGALGLVPTPHQEETSLVSSFSAHFTHHLVSRRHLSAQALENAAHG